MQNKKIAIVFKLSRIKMIKKIQKQGKGKNIQLRIHANPYFTVVMYQMPINGIRVSFYIGTKTSIQK